MALDVKEAVDVAAKYAKLLFPALQDVRLEEVEIVDGTLDAPEQWQITLSFELTTDDPVTSFSSTERIAEMIAGVRQVPRLPRYYKIFTVDAEMGKVRSMKIRKV